MDERFFRISFNLNCSYALELTVNELPAPTCPAGQPHLLRLSPGTERGVRECDYLGRSVTASFSTCESSGLPYIGRFEFGGHLRVARSSALKSIE